MMTSRRRKKKMMTVAVANNTADHPYPVEEVVFAMMRGLRHIGGPWERKTRERGVGTK